MNYEGKPTASAYARYMEVQSKAQSFCRAYQQACDRKKKIAFDRYMKIENAVWQQAKEESRIEREGR